VSRRGAPRPLSDALGVLNERLAPASTLGSVQRLWASVVGEPIARGARPVSEHDGVLQIACDDAVWASELELLGPSLVSSLNAAIGRDAVRAVRVRADGAKGPRRGR
jgi:predicted nucleic acid-binding Zn ribbon protein